MYRQFGFAIKVATVAVLVFSTSSFAVAPDNAGFEDTPDEVGWTALYDGDFYGASEVLRGTGEATEGDAFGRLSFGDYIGSCGGIASGPAYQSSVFPAATGEVISFDWRITGFTYGGFGDAGYGVFDLIDASDDTIVDSVTTAQYGDAQPWMYSSLVAPSDGFYYLELRDWSADWTYGCLVGAFLDIDNVTSNNQAPDCSGAFAKKNRLWPPNHKFKEISIKGVTDPDGDMITIIFDSVFQDEPVNASGDGNTCPDAMGIGTDKLSVRAERIGGEDGNQGDGRVYYINFTASDGFFGSSCQGTVRVGVPHSKKAAIVSGGPLFDSAPATCE